MTVASPPAVRSGGFWVAGLKFSWLTSRTSHPAMASSHACRGCHDHALVTIQVQGQGEVQQNGRTVPLASGSMVFIDGTRPYQMRFLGPFRQLHVRVPLPLLSRQALAANTPVELGPGGPGPLVAGFLVGLDRQHESDSRAAAALAPHAVALIEAALTQAGREPGGGPGDEQPDMAPARERIRRYIAEHAADPGLDADMVAAGCGMSRRTMFRALAVGREPFSALVRQARVARASHLLLAEPGRLLTSISAECGFSGPAQLHRAFRRVTGTTPAAYRRSELP
jgi:AraC-like DNA-binding protein